MERMRTFEDLITNSGREVVEAVLRADEAAGKANRLGTLHDVLQRAVTKFGGPTGLTSVIAAAPLEECGCCVQDRPVIVLDGQRYLLCNLCVRTEALEERRQSPRTNATAG